MTRASLFDKDARGRAPSTYRDISISFVDGLQRSCDTESPLMDVMFQTEAAVNYVAIAPFIRISIAIINAIPAAAAM